MPCSGNILFTLTGQTYVAMTSGGTLLVVACSYPGGVGGWRLTATSAVTSDTYSADAASTCTPFNLIFYNVIIDCGVVNIVLSSNLSACTSSSSAAPTASSSSDSPSESSSGSGGGGIIVDCCGNPLPEVLHLALNGSGCCVAGITEFDLTYDPGGSLGEGWYSDEIACGETTLQWFFRCVGIVDDVPLFRMVQACDGTTTPFSGGNSTIVACSPFSVTIPWAQQLSCCSLSNIFLTITE